MSIRSRTNEAGFTLIELLVVMIIVSILATVAAFAFQSQKSRAHHTKVIANIDSIAKVVDACGIAMNPEGGYTGCADEYLAYEHEPSFKNNERVKSNSWHGQENQADRYEISGIGEDGNVNDGTNRTTIQVGFQVTGVVMQDGKLLTFLHRQNPDGSVDRTCTTHKRVCPKGVWK